MKIIKILGLICFLTIGIWAQQAASVSGTITDAQGAAAGASVVLTLRSSEAVKFTATTDAVGNYRFENIPPGRYVLTASRTGARAGEVSASTFVSLKSGAGETVNLEMSAYAPIRETVNISADAVQPLAEVSKTVNIIEARELRERADFALVDALRTIPGFRVQQLGGFGRTASIKTRGLRNQDTALLLDGIRFRDAASITGDASAFLSDLTLTSVRRIEVLRGSGSSLYGTNAIGGVVDLQTPQPRKGFHGQLSGAFGGLGLGRIRGNVSDGTQDGKFGFNLGVSRTEYAKGIDGDDGAHNTNFQSRIEYNPFEKTNISARFFISDSFVRLNSSPDTIGNLPASNSQIIEAVPLSLAELERYANGTPRNQLNVGNATFIPDTNDPDNFQKSKFFNGQLVFTQIFNDSLVFQGFYQGLKTSRENENGVLGVGFQPFGGAQTSIFDGQIHTLNGHFDWTAGANNLITFGYEYEREKFGNEGFAASAADNFFTRAAQSSRTLYVQDLLSFLEKRLQITGAFRAQWFDLETPIFSSPNFPNRFANVDSPPASYTGDGSISYYFESIGTKIRAHIGNGYRVPSLYERFGTFYSSFFGGFVGLGNPDLKPERSVAFDGGVDQTAFGNRLQLSAAYFYTELKDVITYRPTDAIGSAVYFNLEGGISRGAEFSGRAAISSSTDVFASYTFTNSDQLIYVNNSGLPSLTSLLTRTAKSYGIPDHQFTLVATQRFGKRLSLNFDFLAASDYLAPIFSNQNFRTYIYRFDGARRGDFTARYELPAYGEKLNFVVFGTIENVFGDEYYENGFRTVGRNGRVGLGLSF